MSNKEKHLEFRRRSFLKQGTMMGMGAAMGFGALAFGSNSKSIASTDLRQQDDKPEEFFNFQLGLAAYSFRTHFEFIKGKPQAKRSEPGITMFEFIDYCARRSVAGAELTSYFFPPDADKKYFLKIRRHAFNAGVNICGTAIGNNFSKGKGDYLKKEVESAKRWIDHAATMGAPHIRFFAGTAHDFAKHPDNMKVAIETLQTCCDYAANSGVMIGVENHGKLTADQVLEIVGGVESDWFGVNLDTGNFQTEDPYSDLVRCAPHAVNVQFKVMMRKPDETKYPADFGRVCEIMKNANYKGYVVLEYEEEDPFDNVPKSLNALRTSLA